MAEIKKLDIDLLKPEYVAEGIYNEKRTKYIADYETYRPGGGLFSIGGYVKNPAVGEASWNKMYPGGYEDWKGQQRTLNAHGQQQVIDKINEIIEALKEKK